MSRVKIKLVILGHLPHSINFENIRKRKSDIFELTSPISSFNLSGNSDGQEWQYSDLNISRQLPDRDGADILLAVANVPLQSKYYVRCLPDNKICVTYHTIAEALKNENIPFENLIVKLLYLGSLAFKYYGSQTPKSSESVDIMHDETKGCIFDITGYKTEIIYSLNKPILCNSCAEKLTNNTQHHKLETDLIKTIKKELKTIKKTVYFQLIDFVKRRPILSIIISSLVAILLGIIGSTIAAILWEIKIQYWL